MARRTSSLCFERCFDGAAGRKTLFSHFRIFAFSREPILNLLRKMELYKSPFLPESQDTRREIAVLLSDLGHHNFADMAIHQWVIEWDISGKLSGLHTRVFEIIGKAFFMR